MNTDTSKYAGKQFFALVSRMGGMFRDIHALAIYEFSSTGVPRKTGEALSCVANKAQIAAVAELTEHCGYILGRPTLARMQSLSEDEIDRLVG